MSVRRFRTRIAAIALAGLVLRLAWILLGDWSPERQIGDAGFFHGVANVLAAGDGFSVPDDPARPPTALHPPLWPLLLALPSALGFTGWMVHRVVGAVVGATTVVLVGLLGKRVGGERAGHVAAAIAAVYPIFIRIDGSVMSEPLCGFFVAAVLFVALRLLGRPTPALAAALGALVGLAALTRTETLMLLPLLALPVTFAAGGRRGLNAAAVVVACALVLVPWTARNWAAFDRFAPLSSNSGTALAGANCDRTYKGVDLGFWRFDCARGPTGGSEADRAARLRSQGLEYARDHAGRLPIVMTVRLLRTWDLYQPFRQATLSEGRHVLLAKAGTIAFYAVAVLALVGAARLRRRRRELLVLLAPVILVTVTAIATLGAPRLRFSAEIPLMVLAAVALARERQA